MNNDYWQGVYDTCLYFLEELGMEDAMYTSMAEQAMEELGITYDYDD